MAPRARRPRASTFRFSAEVKADLANALRGPDPVLFARFEELVRSYLQASSISVADTLRRRRQWCAETIKRARALRHQLERIRSLERTVREQAEAIAALQARPRGLVYREVWDHHGDYQPGDVVSCKRCAPSWAPISATLSASALPCLSVTSNG